MNTIHSLSRSQDLRVESRCSDARLSGFPYSNRAIAPEIKAEFITFTMILGADGSLFKKSSNLC